MVDVGNKEDTNRSATASGRVFMGPETIDALKKQELQKGNVLGVARVAGIQAAKRTSDLIPQVVMFYISQVAFSQVLQESLFLLNIHTHQVFPSTITQCLFV